MDTAIIGFVGVIAGSLTTGGVQYAVESTKRRNDSVMAGRLVYGALVEVDQALGAYTNWGHVPARASFQRQVAMWETQKEKMARVLDVVDFQIVQAAFSTIWYIDDAIETGRQACDKDGGLTRLRTDPNHSGRIDTVQEAETIALRASLRLVDHLKGRRHRKRLAELPGNESFLAGLRSGRQGP